MKYILFLFCILSVLIAAISVHAREVFSDYLDQGNSLYFEGQPEEALEAYRQFLILNPDSFAAWINTAIICRDLDRYPEALQAYNKASALSSEDPLVFCNLGWAYYNLGDFSSAYQSFQKTISLMAGVPDSPIVCEAYFGLGSLYLSQKSYQTAEEKLQQAIGLNRHYAPAYFALGLAYEEENRTDEAINSFIKTLEADYNFVEAHIHLARLYFAQKLYEKSFRQYTKVTSVAPYNKEAIQKKEELLALLGKKAEEIIPPPRIPENTAVKPVSAASSVPLMKIGIGVNERGQPLPKDKVYFKCGGPFNLITKSNQGILIGGTTEGLWRIDLNQAKDKFSVFDPQERQVAQTSQTVVIRLLEPATKTIIIQNIGYGQGFHWSGEEDREYRGEIEITLSEKYGLE
ncbi:MAG: tetratricopeptide repeat protein, partial [bacterium]